MKEGKLSVIVPLYNNEKYIRDCLDSIRVMNRFAWECIIVDDGSNDKSGEIADEYASNDNRFVSIHIPNGGVSNARNVGLKKASGTAVLFLDSDDWLLELAEDAIQDALEKIPKEIFTVFSHVKVYRNGEQVVKLMPDVARLRYEDTIVALTVRERILNHCWGIVFDKSVIDANSIMFDTSMRVAEDTCFVLEYLKHSKEIYVSTMSLIAYRDNEDSVSHQTGMDTLRDDELCFRRRKQMLEALNIHINAKEYSCICNFHFSNLVGYLSSDCVRQKAFDVHRLIKQSINSTYGKELLEHCDKTGFSISKRVLLATLKIRAYWLSYVLIYLFARKKQIRNCAASQRRRNGD